MLKLERPGFPTYKSVTNFYLSKGAMNLPHYRFMEKQRMIDIFYFLKQQDVPGTHKDRINEAIKDLKSITN
ncbi:MAG: hypothetical protein RI952_1533 [Bacteroidota bacterium]|jgi:hypothetical protein